MSLTKNGAGTQTFGGVSTYTGATTINSGTLLLAVANALPSGSGKSDVTIVGSTIVNGLNVPGTLDIGGFDQAVNGLNSSTGGFVTTTVPLTWNGSSWFAADRINVLTVGNNDASGSFNGTLQDGITIVPNAGLGAGTVVNGILGFTKTGAGTQTLSGLNTYTGATTVSGGTLTVALGGSLASTNVQVDAGATYNGNTAFGLAAGTTLVNNGEVHLSNSTQSLASLNGAQTAASIVLDSTQLTVTGGGSFAGSMADGVAPGGLTAAGGTLTLSGASTYTGATNVTAGTLAVNGGLGGALGGTVVSVSSTATLQAIGNTTLGTASAGSISVAAGGTLSLQDGAISTLALANTTGSLSLGLASVLKLDLSPSSLLNQIDSANIRSLTLAGNAIVNLNVLGGAGSLSNGTYTLLTYASGSTLGGGMFTFDGTNNVFSLGDGRTYTLTTGATALELTAAGAASLSAYWSGARSDGSWSTVSGVGNDTNWLDGTAGVDTHAVPDANTDVFLTAATATNLATTLDAAFSVKSLTFTGAGTTAASTSVSIASGIGAQALTVGAGGITVQAGSASHGISAPVVLGANQTWTNNTANVVQHVNTSLNGVLRVSGNISGSGRNLTVMGAGNIAVTGNITTGGNVTMSGTGNLVMAGNVDANVAINSGTVAMGGRLTGATNNFALNSGGTFSPGAVAADNAPGIGTFTNESATGTNVWNGGSHVVFQFNAISTLGTAGTNWDFIDNLGTGLLISASAASPVTLQVESFLAGSRTVLGAADGFDPNLPPSQTYQWLFATNVSLAGADPVAEQVVVDASGVWTSASYPGGYGAFTQPMSGGNFFVSRLGGNLYLNYAAVPEPGSLLLVGLAAAGFAAYRRRRRSNDQASATDVAQTPSE
ncbi:MAG: autotransporter-associated beta strand repeat-containing protein [Pirellulales bacterium]